MGSVNDLILKDLYWRVPAQSQSELATPYFWQRVRNRLILKEFEEESLQKSS